MKTTDKHYKFINSRTGYVIYYHSIDGELSIDEIKDELRKIRDRVASQNTLYLDTVYWEEIKTEDTKISDPG